MAFNLTTLSEYAKVQGGFAYKSKDFIEYSDNKVLKIKNVRFGTVNYEDSAFVSNEIAQSTKLWETQEGDILISMTGSGPNAPQSLVGRVARIWANEPKAYINQRVGRIKLKEEGKVHSDFLFYLLSLPQSQDFLVSNSSGSANQANISGKIIEMLPCPEVTFEESESIANIARSLDEKIILNRQTNQTLEQMAQALFKSWFVDFDPVFDNALASGMAVNDFPEALQKKALLRQQQRQQAPSAGKEQQQSANGEPSADKKGEAKTLPEDIRQLFPSEFEQTDEPSIGINGWIPNGWHIEAVSKAIQVNPKTTLPKQTVAKFADMKAIPTSGYMVDEIIEKEYKGGAKFIAKDILFARITPCLQNGKTALVDFLSDNEVGFGSTEFIVLRQKDKVSYPFVACLAREGGFRSHCMQSMVGSSGRQRVQNACFDDYYLALPDKQELLEQFTEMTSANFSKMIANKLESQSLTKLRDTLLPKLISGELTLPVDNSTASAAIEAYPS
ncbi:restriction endonuclease subunit S [Pseudoalteromonas sp. MMG012]|uniref:restriction endonuclease subunit S n=1 Tax=Pseudoalteromonas sp. MMG012 TaxID=2822686 RepID=UPI001B3A6AA4|nr:restriction endonuclease subunit S [Pseudoalteromonas sp. MMG012]MBQ4849835.1 restriction endonuclease subunit S [Pseudoalteromonas sp. MMG012]